MVKLKRAKTYYKFKTKVKKRSKHMKITREIYKEVKELLKANNPQSEVATIVGLSQPSISTINSSKNYKGYWTWVDKHNEKRRVKENRLPQKGLLSETLAKKALQVLVKYFSKK